MIGARHVFTLLFLLTAHLGLYAERLPYWMIPLRDAIYGQSLTADEVRPLYLEASAAAWRHTSGVDRYLSLSHAECLMGRAFFFEGRNREASAHFREGARLAEIAVRMAPCTRSWVLRAKNLDWLARTGSRAFALSASVNVRRFAQNALEFDGRNATAQYLVAVYWLFAPRPFGNVRRGMEMMKAVPENGDMEKCDLFNVAIAIGWAYVRQGRYDEARPWILKGLEVFPTNRSAAGLLEASENRGRRIRSRPR
jgi:tetratricopeptide (TPR) repeat protein